MAWNESIPILRFKGLRNNSDTMELDHTDLREAVNFYIDDEGWLHSRDNYTPITDVETLYVTDDKQAGYVVSQQVLYYLNPNTDTLHPIQRGIGPGPYTFANAGRQVFLMGAEKSYVVYPNRIIDWGIVPPALPTLIPLNQAGMLCAGQYRVTLAYVNKYHGNISGSHDSRTIHIENENSALLITNIPQQTGCEVVVLLSEVNGSVFYRYGRTAETEITITTTDHLSRPFRYTNMYPPPLGQHIAFWKGSMWVSVYNPDDDFTELFCSIPNMFHHFPIGDNSDLSELGEVRLLVATDRGLLIGTDRNIVLYRSVDERIELAQYAVPLGNQWDYDYERHVWFTTTRGIRTLGKGEQLFDNPNRDKYRTNWGGYVGCGFVSCNGVQQFISCGLIDDDTPKVSLPPFPIENLME